MSNEHILLVDDDPAVCEGVAYALGAEGYRVTTAADGVQAIAAARQLRPDLVILDLILPNLSGTDVCLAIRRDSSVPIIMLTARTEEADRVIGLEMGADDYITKPFSMRELIARVRAVLRRASRSDVSRDADVMHVQDINLDTSSRTAYVRGQRVDLTPREFELLKCLMSNPNRVMERRALFKWVWGEDSCVGERTLDVHIRWLRQKIERDPDRPDHIVTIRGIGYKFACG